MAAVEPRSIVLCDDLNLAEGMVLQVIGSVGIRPNREFNLRGNWSTDSKPGRAIEFQDHGFAVVVEVERKRWLLTHDPRPVHLGPERCSYWQVERQLQ